MPNRYMGYTGYLHVGMKQWFVRREHGRLLTTAPAVGISFSPCWSCLPWPGLATSRRSWALVDHLPHHARAHRSTPDSGFKVHNNHTVRILKRLVEVYEDKRPKCREAAENREGRKLASFQRAVESYRANSAGHKSPAENRPAGVALVWM